MGFFSWITQDTDESIANRYSIRAPFPVDMIDDKGNVWHEEDYDGYGEFGGKDYYALLAEMNGIGGSEDEKRDAGLRLSYSSRPNNPQLKRPNLVEKAKGWVYDPLGPEDCPFQGYFYSEVDE